MRSLNDIATDLKTRLNTVFSDVRISAVQTGEQMLQELSALSVQKLPAVLIVFESCIFYAENTLRESKISLVLIDRFKAGSDSRATSVLQSAESLITLFPPDGITVNDVFYIPSDCQTATPDPQFACLGLRLTVRQG